MAQILVVVTLEGEAVVPVAPGLHGIAFRGIGIVIGVEEEGSSTVAHGTPHANLQGETLGIARLDVVVASGGYGIGIYGLGEGGICKVGSRHISRQGSEGGHGGGVIGFASLGHLVEGRSRSVVVVEVGRSGGGGLLDGEDFVRS